jgi:hypothetical protein
MLSAGKSAIAVRIVPACTDSVCDAMPEFKDDFSPSRSYGATMATETDKLSCQWW